MLSFTFDAAGAAWAQVQNLARGGDGTLAGDAAARAWLSRFLIGAVDCTLERLAAAEKIGLSVDDGIDLLADEMAAQNVRE